MQIVPYFLAFFATILMTALPARAATIQTNAGDVLVDQGTGSGYRAVKGTFQAKPGDTVMAQIGGSADVIYDDGCRQKVEFGTIVTIAPVSPCKAGPPVTQDYSLAVGAVVVGAGVGAVILLSDGDSSSKPASK